jgi:hypothetical protein
MRANLGLDNPPNADTLLLTAVPANLFEHPLCGVDDPTSEDDGITQPVPD